MLFRYADLERVTSLCISDFTYATALDFLVSGKIVLGA